MKAFGELATAAARFQDALDTVKNTLVDFKRPFEESIQTIERIRELAPSLPEAMLIQMTISLRDGAADLRRQLKHVAPGVELAAILLRTEGNLRGQIEKARK